VAPDESSDSEPLGIEPGAERLRVELLGRVGGPESKKRYLDLHNRESDKMDLVRQSTHFQEEPYSLFGRHKGRGKLLSILLQCTLILRSIC
jgi:hypothetical protein